MEAAARKWLSRKAEAFLERIGIGDGQTVLDFGCNEGNYTTTAARIVGETGRVYALDKDKEALDKLVERVRKKRLRNIELLHVKEEQNLPLSPCSVDVVLLYDTLHRGYLPEAAQRRKVLQRIHTVLKPRGLLSCYPTHLRRYGLTFRKLLKEITGVGFRLEHKHRRTLIHDGKLVRGQVFSFKKRSVRAGRN